MSGKKYWDAQTIYRYCRQTLIEKRVSVVDLRSDITEVQLHRVFSGQRVVIDNYVYSLHKLRLFERFFPDIKGNVCILVEKKKLMVFPSYTHIALYINKNNNHNTISNIQSNSERLNFSYGRMIIPLHKFHNFVYLLDSNLEIQDYYLQTNISESNFNELIKYYLSVGFKSNRIVEVKGNGKVITHASISDAARSISKEPFKIARNRIRSNIFGLYQNNKKAYGSNWMTEREFYENKSSEV